MGNQEKQTFVLVHGAWHGAWVWRDTIKGLREKGHVVTAPTLTGLGERFHIGNLTADLTTHIEDVVAHIEMEDLHDITLVGWSYGGMVVTGVLAHIPEKVKSLIYVDAFVPEDGKALIDYTTPEAKEILAQNPEKGIAAPALEFFGVKDPAVLQFVTPRLTIQPRKTFYEPVKALTWGPKLPVPVGYIHCSGYERTFFILGHDRLTADPRVRMKVIDTSHLCMLTAPVETINALAELATVAVNPSAGPRL